MINNQPRRTLLLVDDEPANLQLLSAQLRGEYHVLVAKSGEQALRRLKDNVVDLVVLDIVMPDMNGYGVLMAMKSEPKWMHIPVIFVSAKSDTEDEMQGLLLGAVDYITKPFVPAIVQARVRTQIELVRKTELLERLAHIDGLTELANRRKFDETLVAELKRAKRSGEALSLAMIDVDYFKRFNDSAGHQAGDECLRKLAQALNSVAQRSSDVLARYGGEEFALIAPATDKIGATQLAEQCLSAVAELALKHPDSDVGSLVSISLGVVTLEKQAMNTDNSVSKAQGDEVYELALSLITRADQELYKAKKSGRNGFCQS